MEYLSHLALVVSAAWNGMLLGIVSLMQVEAFLARYLSRRWVAALVLLSFALCGYGIFLGRVLRFNTWDVLVRPHRLVSATAAQLAHPISHAGVWGFTALFAVLFGIGYKTVRALGREAG